MALPAAEARKSFGIDRGLVGDPVRCAEEGASLALFFRAHVVGINDIAFATKFMKSLALVAPDIELVVLYESVGFLVEVGGEINRRALDTVPCS